VEEGGGGGDDGSRDHEEPLHAGSTHVSLCPTFGQLGWSECCRLH
jgi:hypothetical protein